jgi:alkaline phosphatase D
VPDVRVLEERGGGGVEAASGGVIEPGVAAVFTLAGLEPACTYEIEVLIGEVVVDRVTLRTPQPPAATGRVELVVGSCADTSGLRDVPAYEAMAARVAHAAILLGDNCYYINALGGSSDSFWKGGWFRADWDDRVRMLLRQLAARNHPQLARLARTTRMHATWDDHDFGYNNAAGHDRTVWAGRDTSAAIHRALWAAPYVDDRAIYYAFREGPVEVFVTDSRYDADRKTKTVLGETQLAWLLRALRASDAPVKLVALSSQFLYRKKRESFRTDAPDERQALLDALPTVGGRVVLLTGDVHYHELARWPVDGDIQLLEFTASGLRTGETDDPLVEWEPGARVWAVQADAFGVVIVDTQSERAGTITFEVRDASGECLREATWDLATGLLR